MAAPTQQVMGSGHHFSELNFLTSMNYSTKAGSASVYAQPPPCKDWLFMWCCPCFPIVRYTGETMHVEYTKPFTPLGCLLPFLFAEPWSTYIDEKRVGTLEQSGCCENGLMWALCPSMKCSGQVKLLEIHRRDDNDLDMEIFTLRKELYCCWHCHQSCMRCCVPCGMCAACCNGTMKYCGGQEYMTVTQPVYPTMEEGDSPVGSISIIKKADMCMPPLTPIKVSVEAPGTTSVGDVASLGLLSLFYGDAVDLPNKLCTSCSHPVQQPTGLSCADTGLNTKVEWDSFEALLAKMHNKKVGSGIQGGETLSAPPQMVAK